MITKFKVYEVDIYELDNTIKKKRETFHIFRHFITVLTVM